MGPRICITVLTGLFTLRDGAPPIRASEDIPYRRLDVIENDIGAVRLVIVAALPAYEDDAPDKFVVSVRNSVFSGVVGVSSQPDFGEQPVIRPRYLCDV